MKIPLYRLLSLLSVPLALCGCLRSPEEPSPEDKPREAQITLTLHTEPVRSKALYGALDDGQERAVRDLSLYLFHRSVPEASQRLYITNPSGAVSLRLIHGDYDLLVLANTGADPGEMTLDELEAYRLDVTREADLTVRNALVMSAREYLHVDSDGDIPVTLERCAVRLDLSVTLAESCPAGLALHSVSLRNVAGWMTPFGENRPDVKNLLSPYGGLFAFRRAALRAVLLPLREPPGRKSAIRSQAERDLSRAPKGATLVHIEASYGGRPLNYYVFLGGNTSTDFNLRRNHRYTVEVNILGPSDVDTRVSTTDLLVDEPPAAGHNLSQTARMILTPVCTNDPDAEMTLRYTLLEGTGSLAINDLTIFPGGFRTVRPASRWRSRTCKAKRARAHPLPADRCLRQRREPGGLHEIQPAGYRLHRGRERPDQRQSGDRLLAGGRYDRRISLLLRFRHDDRFEPREPRRLAALSGQCVHRGRLLRHERGMPAVVLLFGQLYGLLHLRRLQRQHAHLRNTHG
ncbi:MAG: hypothetical protein ACLR8Y_16405 [Alistipes indistinctus]